MDGFKRKTPEEILLSISKLHRGSFKIYIGAVSGSGKTYHMLREGHNLKQQGIDVVICAVSTLQRPETVEQLGDLERVPSIHWIKDGVDQKDLNLDALIERNPEVVLVDGLAHLNRSSARFPTRLDDIKFLLSNNISVITTVNVYELEEAMEVAHKLTGIEVGHCVSSDTLELADEVRLIDATPEMILNRLEEGHVKGNKDSALFKRGNLGVLRELALRLVAEDVNDSLEEHREQMGFLGPSGATERILVTTQYHWNGSIYVRRGQQIAKRLNGDLLVVTLRKFNKSLTKEAATFRRSIMKLVEKIGGKFDELPLRHRRCIPKILVDYAIAHKVTRIVLGHSRQTQWQTFLQGSVINGVLKRTKNIDVYLVADTASKKGERILPAHMHSLKETYPYKRLSKQEVQAKIEKIKRGRFKVYIGAAPGVGKTYTMLREGNDLLKKGIDVKIGLLETHGRKETIGQIGELDIIPRAEIQYQGVRLEEMDTEAIIRLRPEVILVDELAHSNVPGSQNKKRYEDVLDILEAGISVIATVNVQHLESLNDAVEHITGIRVRETVPDSILRTADEVQLIDVSPQALQLRMRDGKVYAMAKVDQALNNFFKTGNLIALRELALREIADDVDERLESMERKSSLRGPWRRKEVIYVCLTEISQADRLIRRGFRIAHRLKATWYVSFIAMGNAEEWKQKIEALEKLTVRLGGEFSYQEVVSRNQIPEVFASQASKAGATQIIVWKDTVVKKLLPLASQMDVLIVADTWQTSGNKVK
ncbi:two-component system, OmpR family, sensor histidine kinase KdpD [Paenibacillus sp. yr247]|uniref:histidine kinase n=1 Tax=Paenibacillus sp. yr247 TaxID=1761880 RepID=UPI000887FAF6|nr:histidine kinase [Paenibacillus sp. yr247]SDN42722.1 two-component system, OmpR family, sensor histidine kinase KdpD [Paenibacillus sp. yr247]